MEEIFKDIAGYEGQYQVSNLGNVLSLDYKGKGVSRLLKGRTDKDGYKEVTLFDRNIRKATYHRVHRLVATAFLENPDNLPVINHKDENKENNCVDNLEWCTVQYNTLYSSYKLKGENNGMNKIGVREKHKEKCKAAHEQERFLIVDIHSRKIYRGLRNAEKALGISRYKIKRSLDYLVFTNRRG